MERFLPKIDTEAIQKQISRYRGLNEEPKTVDKEFLMSTIENPIDFKKRKVGKYRIEIDIQLKGQPMTVVSWRNFLMMGYRPTQVIMPENRYVHKLIKDGQGLLMSDSPQEMFLQYEAYKAARGRVLIGGLGLGMFTAMAAKKSEVTEIIVIEIEEDIIDLIEFEHPKVKIICDDIWRFLRTTADTKFDFIYIDIHYSTGCKEYINTVLPMRKILEKRFPNIPAMFWGEKEMEAQYDPDFEKEVKQ